MWGGIDRSQPLMDQYAQFFQRESVGVRHFVDAIVENKPVSPTFYDGLRVQEVIDAALESAESGRTVVVRSR